MIGIDGDLAKIRMQDSSLVPISHERAKISFQYERFFILKQYPYYQDFMTFFDNKLEHPLQWPTASLWNALLAESLKNHIIQHNNMIPTSIHFVDDDIPAMKKGYEQSIVEDYCIPLRRSSWHDLCNALTWCVWPHIKWTLTIQLNAWCQEEKKRGLKNRSSARDVLAMLDEGGIILWVPQENVKIVWKALERKTNMLTLSEIQERWHGTTMVLGHAILETQLLRNDRIRCFVYIVTSEQRPCSIHEWESLCTQQWPLSEESLLSIKYHRCMISKEDIFLEG